MRTKCISVRLESLVRISPKAFKANAYDGSSAIIPESQIFGPDFGVEKSEAWWISEWILRQKQLQWSPKKIAWFDSESRKQLPSYVVEKHSPGYVAPLESNEIESLKASE